MLFAAVDLLNHGLNATKDTITNEEKVRIAKLNLAAGQNAMSVAAYRQSKTYLEISIQCLIDASGGVDLAWSDHHDLCREAYQASADCLYWIGNKHDELKELVDTIFKHTTSKEGRMKAYETLVEEYVAKDDSVNAFDTLFLALDEFGEKMVKNPSQLSIIVEFVRTKKVSI